MNANSSLVNLLLQQNSALKKSENGHKYDLRKLDSRTSFILEDMDISDSDDEWIASGKPKTKKRKSKYGSSSEGFNAQSSNDSGGFKLDSAGEGIVSVVKKSESGVCCSCSKTSSCKTTKCQCRTTGGACGPSCGCVPAKCSNRESSLVEVHGSPEGETAQGIGNDEGTDETEKNQHLASQGARLLQNALVERPSETTDDGGPRRKALSEIGNTLAKSNAPKPNQRKKWRRTTIQLVANAPPPSQPATAEAPQRPDKGAPEVPIPMKLPQGADKGAPEAPIPMKLPRAMRSAASNGGNLFRERNSDKADQSGVSKEAGVPAPRSPLRQNKTSDEKENCGL
ncbi:kinesin-like protein KIN-4C isoform X1 [Rosa rugosa]|uniref:kinesin-like protein KIN-4C isoform X1 n=2 Tax=Rosa rugosa TaxID=74645 RepID=UPI002B402B71|nr:kinesin-like protein KIN-4C isoform X1 [Rosa rugosa]